MTLHEAGQLLLLEIKAMKLSPKTAEFYANRCAYFTRSLGAVPVDRITIHDLRQLLADSPARSARHNYIAIRRLFGFLLAEDIISVNPALRLNSPKVPQRVVHPFSVAEMIAMMNAARRQQGWTAVRDTAIFATLIGTGIRRAELCGLTDEDVDLKAGILKVLGKGNRERCIPLPTKLCKILLRYTFDRRATRVYGSAVCSFFFRDRFGGPLTPNALTRIIRRLGKSIGIKAWPHRARHSFATYFMDNAGADLQILQELCGWSSLEMSLRYVKPSRRRVRDSLEGFSPVNLL